VIRSEDGGAEIVVVMRECLRDSQVSICANRIQLLSGFSVRGLARICVFVQRGVVAYLIGRRVERRKLLPTSATRHVFFPPEPHSRSNPGRFEVRKIVIIPADFE
jgi:hypothetical protein